MSFSISAKGWFLTYPQCPADKQKVFDVFCKMYKPLELVVASEKHKSGEPHIHVFLKLKEALSVKSPDYFDLFIGGEKYHCNIQSAKSFRKVISYVQKDGNYLSHGIDVKDKIRCIEGHRRYLGKRLLDNELTLVDLVKEEPQLLFAYSSIKRSVVEYQRDLATSKEDPKEALGSSFPNTWGIDMPVKREKQRHYWIWSKQPNKGKTTFLLGLERTFSCFWYNTQEVFQNTPPRAVQVILIDEYNRTRVSSDVLCAICDGTYQHPVKQGQSFSLRDCIVIICSNEPIQHLYQRYEALIKARFVEVELH